MKMKYIPTEGMTSCSVGGATFNVGDDGLFDLPDDGNYASLLAPHGILPAGGANAPSAPLTTEAQEAEAEAQRIAAEAAAAQKAEDDRIAAEAAEQERIDAEAAEAQRVAEEAEAAEKATSKSSKKK
jgi:hypothetical protein